MGFQTLPTVWNSKYKKIRTTFVNLDLFPSSREERQTPSGAEIEVTAF
jgi:hypothetical protein